MASPKPTIENVPSSPVNSYEEEDNCYVARIREALLGFGIEQTIEDL